MTPIEIDYQTLLCLIQDGLAICGNCEGMTDGVSVDARNKLCDCCGLFTLQGVDALLAEGVLVVAASA